MAFTTNPSNKVLNFTAGQLLVGNAQPNIASGLAMGAGTVLIGTAATTAPKAANLTAGTGISITNASGSITISAQASTPAVPVTTAFSANTTAVWGQNYVAMNNAILTFPTPTQIGQSITVTVSPYATAYGFTIQMPANYGAYIGAAFPSAPGQTIVSTGAQDSITLQVVQLYQGTGSSGAICATSIIGTMSVN